MRLSAAHSFLTVRRLGLAFSSLVARRLCGGTGSPKVAKPRPLHDSRRDDDVDDAGGPPGLNANSNGPRCSRGTSGSR